MANWQEKFKSWESQLTKNTDTSRCVEDIKQTVEAISKAEGRATIVCKVVNMVGRVKNIKAGIELFTSLSKHIFDNFWNTFLPNFKYFVSVLISKKQWDEALAILPLIDKCELNDATLEYIFYIYSTCYVSLVAYDKVPESNFKLYSDQIAKALQKARRRNADEFLNLVSDLFGSNRNFQIVMLKQFDGAAWLLHFISNEISKCGRVNVADGFGGKCCMLSIFLVSVDARNKTRFTLAFLKECLTVMKNAKDQDEAKILMNLLLLASNLIKLLVESEIEEFDKHLGETFDHLSKTLRCRKPNESWLACGVHIVSKILLRYFCILSRKIETENISSIFTFLENSFHVWQQTKSRSCQCSKTICLECDDLVLHTLWNLLLVHAITLRKSMQFQIQDARFSKLYAKMLNEAMQLNDVVTCPELKAAIQTAFREGYGVIKESVQTKMWADVSYDSLSAWRNIKTTRNMISETQTISLYRHLLKMKGLYRKSLEMQCLYVAHLLAAPDSKRDTILQEMALCSAGYSEAGIDYELSICDILDKANIDFEVPAYYRKLAIRLQLEASAKYQGTDAKLKTFLAKKVISETSEEVELANVLSVLGKISVPELQTKVDRFVQSLKKKLTADRSDPFKHLALARLLIRQYQFTLEKCKESAEGKSFSESVLHEMDLEYFEKFDICSENSIKKVLVNAMECFETFSIGVDANANEIEWNHIVDDISFLARHFSLRGYFGQAYKCWHLIHGLAVQFDLKLPRIRSVSFFAEYSDVIEHIPDAINPRTAINSDSDYIVSELQLLDQYSPRQQNYILLAIINIASYYHRQHQWTNARILAEMAHNARRSLKDRENCMDLISIQLMAFNFIRFSNCGENETCELLGSPYAYLHSLLDAISKVKYITSEDSINLPMLLFRIVVELAHFAMYRLCASPIRPYLYSLLQCIVAFSLGCRMVEIVSILTAIDIQMERADCSLMKLAVLNTLLGKSATRSVTNISNDKPKTYLLNVEALDCYDLTVEETRRVPISPKNSKQPYMSSNTTISSEYLLKHRRKCNCDFCENDHYRALSFQVGCLYSQNYYINGDYSTSVAFLADCIAWKQHYWQPSPLIEYLSFHTIFWLFIFHVNNLRRLKRFVEASNLIKDARNYLKKYNKHQHNTYLHIIVDVELSLEDLMKPSIIAEDVAENQELRLALTTPAKTPRIRKLPMPITKSKRKKEDVVFDLTDDWDLSDDGCKENGPNHENCAKSDAKVQTKSRKAASTAKLRILANADATSSSDTDSNKPKSNGCSIATTKSRSRKTSESTPKTGKSTAAKKTSKQNEENIEFRRSARARLNRC